jgi:hypothetical protein
MERAYDFMRKVKSLQETNTIVSEDTFFFRASYRGELIDMGDFVSIVSKRGYYDEEFNKTAKHHFDRLQKQPPDYILTGFTESPEMRELIKEKYVLIGEGPHNLTGNLTADYIGRDSKLFERKDLLRVGSPALGLAGGSLRCMGIQVANSRKYLNPNYRVELRRALRGLGKKINFFFRWRGKGTDRQRLEAAVHACELGTWRRLYLDRQGREVQAFAVVDRTSGPLKSTDNGYFMTSRGQHFGVPWNARLITQNLLQLGKVNPRVYTPQDQWFEATT